MVWDSPVKGLFHWSEWGEVPERDILSLGAMGWGMDPARKLFRRQRPPKKELFGEQHFPFDSDT